MSTSCVDKNASLMSDENTEPLIKAILKVKAFHVPLFSLTSQDVFSAVFNSAVLT